MEFADIFALSQQIIVATFQKLWVRFDEGDWEKVGLRDLEF